MAEIKWSRSYGRRSRQGWYTIAVADNPTLLFVTEQMSLAAERVQRTMETEESKARTGVQARSRVDTGMMRSLVEAYTTASKEELAVEFGWWEGTPLYAPFQEFGTSNGIEPMLAVQRQYLESLARIQRSVGG